MAALDWIFVALLLASMLMGAWRGLVYEVLSLAGWVVAFLVAQWFAADAAAWFYQMVSYSVLASKLQLRSGC